MVRAWVPVSESAAAVCIKRKMCYKEVTDVDCFAAKTTNHCPRILSQRRFDIVTLFMFHGQKMAASSLLLKKKKWQKLVL